MWRIMWRNDYNEARSLQELIEMIQRAEKESARGLAVAIGIGNTTVNRILAGEQIRDFNVIEAISAYTGLSKQHVLALAGHIPPPPHWTPDVIELADLLQSLGPEERELFRDSIRGVLAARPKPGKGSSEPR